MRQWPAHVAVFVLLGIGLAVSHAADIAVWAMPGRFLFDCENGLTEAQKVRLRNSSLVSLGIWKKCAHRVCEADRCRLVQDEAP